MIALDVQGSLARRPLVSSAHAGVSRIEPLGGIPAIGPGKADSVPSLARVGIVRIALSRSIAVSPWIVSGAKKMSAATRVPILWPLLRKIQTPGAGGHAIDGRLGL